MTSTETVALRNRVYRDTPTDQREIDGEAMPRGRYLFGGGAYWGDEVPASGRQTAAIIGTACCFCLLLLGLAYLVWAGQHGGLPWQ
jgi:hypothetical protein